MSEHPVPENQIYEQNVADPKATGRRVPLCVDMDGTLLNTDSLIECFFAVIKDWRVMFALFGWLLKGKAHLKQQLALHARLDPALLPLQYRADHLASRTEAAWAGGLSWRPPPTM